MTEEGRTAETLSRGRLIAIGLGGFALAALVTVVFVLPAEFQRDPTGLGRMMGLAKLGAAEPKVETVAADSGAGISARYYLAPFRSDEIVIPLAAKGDADRKDRLEYKVALTRGDTVVYSWKAEGLADPNQLHYDFHGEKPATASTPQRVAEYQQGLGDASNGMLVAPMDGVHGWYLENRSARPIVVRLKVSGFYRLVPAGEPGNMAGIEAVKSATP
jgi:hypothetical protein